MKAVSVLVVLPLFLFASACIEDVGEPSRSPTPGGSASTTGAGSPATATRPAVVYTAGPDTPACAAGSTDGFLQGQTYAPFKVYCPTFLPAGFVLEGVHFEESVQPGTPIPGPGSVIATFKRNDPDAAIQFVQGRPELSVITDVRTSSEGEPADTSYGDFEASLFEKGILGRSPDGYTHIIIADGLSTDELAEIAAGMEPVVP